MVYQTVNIWFTFKTEEADDRKVNTDFYRLKTVRLKLMHRILTIGAIFCCAPLLAKKLEGEVSRSVDGHTFVFKDKRQKEHTVVLLGIETPELGQAKYWDGVRTLGALLRKKKVVVDWYRLDFRCEGPPRSRCAKMGKVVRVSDGLDPARELLSRGLAWHNPSTLADQSTTDRRLYQEAERNARDRRIGIWNVETPVPPWEFRKQKGNKPKRKK